MPFPRPVREEALVAAGRSCCICHRFKGVNVEVHHITPESEGGPDTIENAIVLCFDCHADVGHYNAKHPRGTKYSPKELSAHRNQWQAIVRRDGITREATPNLLYVRHLVCQSFDLLAEMCHRDFSRVPFDRVLLHENEIFSFQRDLVGMHRNRARPTEKRVLSYSSADEMLVLHQNAEKIDRSNEIFPTFETKRIPDVRELSTLADSLTNACLSEGIEPSELAVIVGFLNECGATSFDEILRVRPLYSVFLCIENVSGEPIQVHGVRAYVDSAIGLSYREFGVGRGGHTGVVDLPRLDLLPGTAVFLPEATLLAPIEGSDIEQVSLVHYLDLQEQGQELVHGVMRGPRLPQFRSIGPSVLPETILLTTAGGKEVEQPIHSLDPSNVYVLDRFWQCGSCPHLFLRTGSEAQWSYAGKLLENSSPGCSRRDVVPLNVDVSRVQIAELEEERTTITRVSIVDDNSTIVIHEGQLTISKGESLSIPVHCGPRAFLLVEGFYQPLGETVNTASAFWRRNKLVASQLIKLSKAAGLG